MEKKTLPELYLEKLELLNERERKVLLDAIELWSKPVFYSTSEKITRI